jgi:aminopeptidase N
MKKSLVHITFILLLAAVAPAQRLPGDVLPDHYGITLTPDLSTATFSGEEIIEVRLLKPASAIVLNAVEIKFGEVTVTAGGQTQTAKVTSDWEKEMATLALKKAVPAGKASLHIKFTGKLNDKLRGFYLSQTQRRRYAATQFEATDARRAFPSFDEPAMKAVFELTAVVDKGDTAISNTPIASDTPGPGEGKHTLRFEPTPKMSSYLVALAVGDWGCLEGGADGIPIRVCAVPEKKDLGKFALESAEQILKYYDRYYGIKYPYKKLDLVAIPDFAAGAMENTGAIFSREQLLLLDDRYASEGQRKLVAEVNAHEMAHQWFGDLVTAKWWDDIWLNEGFATWATAKPLRGWKPEWHEEIEEARDTAGSLNGDGLASTRPIHASAAEAETPAQIASLFDFVAYGKTAAVLRMIENYMGEEAFRAGVHAYLTKYSYGNATATDFWNTLAASSKKPVDKVMPTFVLQAGAPLVSVQESCHGNTATVQLAQRRFYFDDKLLAAGGPEVWQIPVCLKTPEGGPAKCELMTQKEQSFTVSGCPSWVYLNAGARGYYRTAYSPAMLQKIGSDAEQALSPGERILLLGDEWAMVRSNQHPIGAYLDLLDGLRSERNQQVVATMAAPLGTIGERLASGAEREHYRAWLRAYFRPLWKELGWRPATHEGTETRELRARVLAILGNTARDPEILAQAREMAERYMQDPDSLDPNLASTVLNLAALEGDAKLYDQYVQQVKEAKGPQQHYRYLAALNHFSSPELAQRTLEIALGPEVRSQDMFGAIFGLLFNPDTQASAWEFVQTRWPDIEKKSASGIVGMPLAYAAAAFCDAKSRDEVQNFITEHKLEVPERVLRLSLEEVNECIQLKQQQGQNLASWLKRQGSAAGQ